MDLSKYKSCYWVLLGLIKFVIGFYIFYKWKKDITDSSIKHNFVKIRIDS